MMMQELSAILEEKQITLETVKQQAEALLGDLPGPERQSVELLVRQVQAQHTQVSVHTHTNTHTHTHAHTHSIMYCIVLCCIVLAVSVPAVRLLGHWFCKGLTLDGSIRNKSH